jgi:O-acetyl-ADP-ribose deacetylase (regulator of RNase III)
VKFARNDKRPPLLEQPLKGHLFIAHGDLTQLNAHAIAYSAANSLSSNGDLYSAFAANVPGFAEWYQQLRRGQRQLCQVGDAFWLPLNSGQLPHGVVVVVSTGGPATDEDKASIAVRAALTTALRELRRGRDGSERLLIALPAFRVGKGGDRRQRLRSARAQIKAALEFLDNNTGLDVAFIPYTTPLYQIFLEARRELLGEPAADPQYADLEQSLLSRGCVLFVGAGLSSGAGLPDWLSLMRRLTEDLQIRWHDRLDYLDLAQWYRDRFGAKQLAEMIRQTYITRTHPTLAHYLLLSLPLRHVITTNYDDLVERTLFALKRHPVKVLHQEDVARTGQDDVFVVKLHGDIAHPEEIILSRDDYDEFFQRRPAMALLLEALLLNQTFFFFGYGLRDPNFRQIHSRIVRMLPQARRPAFATTFEAAGDNGPYLIEQWRKKQIQLISIPGPGRAEQEHALLRFLDYLAGRVTLQMPQLFLASELEVSEQLAGLRRLLIEGVGGAIEAFAERDLSGPTAWQDVRYLVEVLDFLTALGWRPSPRKGLDLSRLWSHLAEYAPNKVEERRLLIAALRTAEAFVDVQRIRQKLGELEQKESSPPQGGGGEAEK